MITQGMDKNKGSIRRKPTLAGKKAGNERS
jgi:hypothetical protein